MISTKWMAILSLTVWCGTACKKQEKKSDQGAQQAAQGTAGGAIGQASAGNPGGGDPNSSGGFSGGAGGATSPDPNASGTPDPNASGSPGLSGGSGSTTSTTTNGSFSGNGPGKYISDFEYSSEFYALNDTPKMGNSPHKYVRVWYSKNIQNGINNDNFGSVPVGTVAIKEFRLTSASQGSPDGFAVMIKEEKGYDTANGDWSYELRDKFGDIQNNQRGRVQDCITCHTKFKNTDYLASTKSSGSGGSTSSGSTSGGGGTYSGSPGPGAYKSNYNTSTEFFTQMSGFKKGASNGHGNLQIWYSSNIRDLIESNDDFSGVPQGTVAIARYDTGKTSNDKCKPQVGVVAMIKKTTSGTNNGWTFEPRTSTGALIPSCESAMTACATCHVKVTSQVFDRETDYLYGTELRD